MNLKKTFILILLLSTQFFSQEADKTLAKIGDKIITVEEFKHRFELTPQINRKQNDANIAKEELLYTLIAEKLFALKAEELSLDTSEAMRSNFVPLEKMHVRDALYLKEIKEKIQLNNSKFAQGLKRANHKLFVNYVYSLDQEKINLAYKLLTSNSNFDSLANLLKDVEYVTEAYEVTFGRMNIAAEDAIYNLKLNEFTNVIKAPEGWYIFRLIGSEPIIYNSGNQKISKVKKAVNNRIEDSIYNDFWLNFFKGKNVETDGDLFWSLAEILHKQIVKIKKTNNIKDGEKISLGDEDFLQIRNSIDPDSLKIEFIRFDDKLFTLNDFITEFMYEGFYTYSTELKTIASQLNSRVKRQIENELLAKFGYEKGYESLPDVRSSTDVWKENYLSSLYRRKIVRNSKLTNEDIKNHLTKNSSERLIETQVKIIEILTDSLEVVEEALKLKNENDFIKFANVHSIKKNAGEDKLKFFPISEFGEVGKIAESMNVGDVYGPLQTSEGYSVFKLIDKRENELSFDSLNISDETKNKIRYQKVMNSLEEQASELASKYNVQVNEELLKSIDVLNIQMVVFRYMGFGGRILAVPNVTPFYNWKKKWELKKKDLL
ncbi:MAG: peptidyl-prolyl cis-trans isomerase [Melioribacteraceae bacterium]